MKTRFLRKLQGRLNRCPDCGQLPTIEGEDDYHKIYCPDCGLNEHSRWDTLKRAVAAWNKLDLPFSDLPQKPTSSILFNPDQE